MLHWVSVVLARTPRFRFKIPESSPYTVLFRCLAPFSTPTPSRATFPATYPSPLAHVPLCSLSCWCVLRRIPRTVSLFEVSFGCFYSSSSHRVCGFCSGELVYHLSQKLQTIRVAEEFFELTKAYFS